MACPLPKPPNDVTVLKDAQVLLNDVTVLKDAQVLLCPGHTMSLTYCTDCRPLKKFEPNNTDADSPTIKIDLTALEASAPAIRWGICRLDCKHLSTDTNLDLKKLAKLRKRQRGEKAYEFALQKLKVIEAFGLEWPAGFLTNLFNDLSECKDQKVLDDIGKMVTEYKLDVVSNQAFQKHLGIFNIATRTWVIERLLDAPNSMKKELATIIRSRQTPATKLPKREPQTPYLRMKGDGSPEKKQVLYIKGKTGTTAFQVPYDLGFTKDSVRVEEHAEDTATLVVELLYKLPHSERYPLMNIIKEMGKLAELLAQEAMTASTHRALIER
jgi:hypothetical protein